MGSTSASWEGRCIDAMNCSYVVPACALQSRLQLFRLSLEEYISSCKCTRIPMSFFFMHKCHHGLTDSPPRPSLTSRMGDSRPPKMTMAATAAV